MTEEWLIDGYNLLYDLKSRKNNKGLVTRESLFHLLADFASGTGRRVIIVLDGKGDDSEWRPFQTSQLQILYSQAVSADAHIEKYLCQKKGSCQFFVVTCDRAITNIARGFGAQVLTTELFTTLLSESDKESKGMLMRHQIKGHGFHRPFGEKL